MGLYLKLCNKLAQALELCIKVHNVAICLKNFVKISMHFKFTKNKVMRSWERAINFCLADCH